MRPRTPTIQVHWTGSQWQARLEAVELSGFGVSPDAAVAALKARLIHAGYIVPEGTPDVLARQKRPRRTPVHLIGKT